MTFIWSNSFNGGYSFVNTNRYTGYLLYAYGTTNSTHRSGGGPSQAGHVQTSKGSPLTIKRSGGFEAEIYGNYNTLDWLLLTNDDGYDAPGLAALRRACEDLGACGWSPRSRPSRAAAIG